MKIIKLALLSLLATGCANHQLQQDSAGSRRPASDLPIVNGSVQYPPNYVYAHSEPNTISKVYAQHPSQSYNCTTKSFRFRLDVYNWTVDRCFGDPDLQACRKYDGGFNHFEFGKLTRYNSSGALISSEKRDTFTGSQSHLMVSYSPMSKDLYIRTDIGPKFDESKFGNNCYAADDGNMGFEATIDTTHPAVSKISIDSGVVNPAAEYHAKGGPFGNIPVPYLNGRECIGQNPVQASLICTKM